LNPDKNGVGGLEVLCRAHHAKVTAAQAKARAAARAKLKDTEAKTKTKKLKPIKKLKKRL
jgi:hypothetical protein